MRTRTRLDHAQRRYFLRTVAPAVVACGVAATGVGAQSSDAGGEGLPPILDRTEEVALARSAAPSETSFEASVFVLERGIGFVEVVSGTNGVTCVVNRSWPEAIEPHCYDPEASKTIFAVHREEAALRERGRSQAEIRASVADGYRTGRFRTPTRPAVTWMMSSDQVLFSDEGRRVGAWKPHLMIYFPYMTSADLGLGDTPYADGPMLSDEGRPSSNMIIVMPSFVDVVRRGVTTGR